MAPAISTLVVAPIDATLGARVTGVDLANLDDAAFAAIYKEFLEYGVLIFPDQNLSDEAQAQFALRFGEIERVLDWCKSEVSHDWRWQLVDVSSDIRPGRYIFYFDSERDYLAFTMKWS